MKYIHIPVLLKEVIEFLDPQPNQNFIDCTLGQGGHSREILERTSPRGKLLGIDLDAKAIEAAKERIKKFKNRAIFVQDNFINLKKIINEQLPNLSIHGILFDFGLSLAQLKDKRRGFSFLIDSPLDMRLGKTNLSTSEIINQWPEKDLRMIFRKYGEEKFSRQIVAEIIKARKKNKIKTAKQLATIAVKVYKWKTGNKRWRIHPATRIFQALRIVVNHELENIKEALPQALDVLEPGGKLAVISFHSLEDRIVKHFFLNNKNYLKIITKKPIQATQEEIKQNPRSRSAKLRVAEKL